LTATNDDQYFVFEDYLYQVSQIELDNPPDVLSSFKRCFSCILRHSVKNVYNADVTMEYYDMSYCLDHKCCIEVNYWWTQRHKEYNSLVSRTYFV